jgi:hypothetical protein
MMPVCSNSEWPIKTKLWKVSSMLTGTFLEILRCLEDLACIWGTEKSLYVHEDEGVLCLQTSNTEKRGTHLQEPGTDNTMQQNLAIVTHLLKNSVTK